LTPTTTMGCSASTTVTHAPALVGDGGTPRAQAGAATGAFTSTTDGGTPKAGNKSHIYTVGFEVLSLKLSVGESLEHINTDDDGVAQGVLINNNDTSSAKAKYCWDTPNAAIACGTKIDGADSSRETSISEKPRPIPFAIMRLGHEVLRGGIRDCSAALDAGDIPAFLESWAAFRRWQCLHARMEEGDGGSGRGFFSLLDEHFGGVGGLLSAAHRELEELELALELAAASWKGQILGANGSWKPSNKFRQDLEPLTDAFHIFATANQVHLKAEEDIMTPKVKELSKIGYNMGDILAEDLLTCLSPDDMPFFLEHAMHTLEKHHEGRPRARVFAHALFSVASPPQWREWRPMLQAGTSAELWSNIVMACGI